MDQPDSQAIPSQPTPASVSARIRKHRKARSWTLHDVERISGGRIKAVVMGSYERGTRAISLARTIEIANLFGIPVTELISQSQPLSVHPHFEAIFDLRRINSLIENNGSSEVFAIDRYLKGVAERRRDWNGEILSLRQSDLDNLTLIFSKSTSSLIADFVEWKILVKGSDYL